ncbi:hypothetical protein ROHU_035014 [Labeo rohita]|uniref:Uncharacterized protein n=1 Tax=Labeo rohita TaxID=84645 RepID=A0A498L2V1_LABRO|nr:hypothetical protein ROHU_035014 [Labeo rohita]
MCDAAFLLRSAPVVYGHAMPTSLSGGTLTMESPLQTDGRGLGLFPGAARGLQRRSPVTFHKFLKRDDVEISHCLLDHNISRIGSSSGLRYENCRIVLLNEEGARRCKKIQIADLFSPNAVSF